MLLYKQLMVGGHINIRGEKEKESFEAYKEETTIDHIRAFR